MGKEVRIRVQGILRRDNEILFVQHEKNQEVYNLLPGGGVDYGEDFSEALKREFIEECNLEIEVGEMLFISEGIAPNRSRHIVNIYFEVKKISGELKLGEDEGNLVGVRYIEIDKIKDIVLYPNIKEELLNYLEGNNEGIKYLGNRWE